MIPSAPAAESSSGAAAAAKRVATAGQYRVRCLPDGSGLQQSEQPAKSVRLRVAAHRKARVGRAPCRCRNCIRSRMKKTRCVMVQSRGCGANVRVGLSVQVGMADWGSGHEESRILRPQRPWSGCLRCVRAGT